MTMRTIKHILIPLAVFLALSGAGHARGSLAVAVDSTSGDFIDAGHAQARLSASLVVDGEPVVGADVVWTVSSAANHSAAMPAGRNENTAGLAWTTAVRGNAAPIPELTTATDGSGSATAVLTDIIGERSVLVRATALSGGRSYSAEREVVFGKGPLSVFAAPLPEPVSWLELYGICNGRAYGGDPSQWVIGQGFEGGDKLPTMEHIQAVSLPGKYNKHPAAMGAAVAAGWPEDRRYWKGRVVMKMRAGHVNIRDGNPHGSGGQLVGNKEYGVCLR